MSRLRARSHADLYHVNSSAVKPLRPFGYPGDRWAFVRSLGTAVERYRWRLFGYCVLETHFHLVLRADLDAVSRGIQWLKSRHGWTFNSRNGRRGPVFAERFHAEPVNDDTHALESMAYVELNPVRAGACEHPSDWQWSSYRAHVGIEPGPPWLSPLEDYFGLFDSPEMSTGERYARAIESVLARDAARSSVGLS